MYCLRPLKQPLLGPVKQPDQIRSKQLWRSCRFHVRRSLGGINTVRGSILVVEDEFLIRWSVVDCLSEAGYAVVEAADACSALDALSSSHVDVAVVDIGLPGQMSGLALAEWIGAHRPGVQIILASGDTAGAQAPLRFLAKPFSGAALQTMIEAALCERSASARQTTSRPGRQATPPSPSFVGREPIGAG
jgi:DNA-binding NtrC family response regulator